MSNALINKILSMLPPALGGVAERFDLSPLDSPEKITAFVRTRASYVAQTSLFGYLKARMGTQYRIMFQDDVFSKSIRIASSRVFASCLSDMTIYCVADIVRDGGLTPEEAVALAEYSYDTGLTEGLAEVSDEDRPDGCFDAFKTRLQTVNWPVAAGDIEIFAASAEDLVRFAPVTDEFKEQDGQIVRNSIRLRWGHPREQWQKRLDAPAVTAAWRARDAA